MKNGSCLRCEVQPQVFSNIVDVRVEIINGEGKSTDVGEEIISVPVVKKAAEDFSTS